jgi:hypothetical protein
LNLIDLEDQRVVSTEEGALLAASWKVPFFETSARTRINIDEAIYELLRHTPRNREYKMVIMGAGGI